MSPYFTFVFRLMKIYCLSHILENTQINLCEIDWGGVVITEKNANLAKDKDEAEADFTYLKTVAALTCKPLCHCHQV